MKKILAIAVVLVLIFALAAPVFAATEAEETPLNETAAAANEEVSAEGPSPNGGNGGNGGGNGGDNAGGAKKDAAKAPAGKSPQTGYDTIVWVIAATAMAVCAGFCFVRTGKKVAC